MASQTTVAATRILTSGAASLIPAPDPLAVITDCLEYLRVREVEMTKRAYIAAQRDILVAAITAEQKLISAYFELRFTERRSALDQLFTILQQGIDGHDSAVIDRSITGILGILQDNPLKDIDSFRTNWQNPSFVLDL
jgi:hypothetical protein